MKNYKAHNLNGCHGVVREYESKLEVHCKPSNCSKKECLLKTIKVYPKNNTPYAKVISCFSCSNFSSDTKTCSITNKNLIDLRVCESYQEPKQKTNE